ncbi:lytic transglycosylase domain-containing protein [Arthrobacter burdickii]|uniref:LysM peptidoglycan-binding domain-containing protein n=1 Tax=Arthrobacter burdickii TaxID=3035920 RepID=A0ABT8K4W2_9MICC|nr:lytic transglycosylase domain-containing protein [Arthrobacter burdickii]MDN4612067.1 LysM peptidoglycan-binding domain-containing protein [Arthrobacter burdickii]
MTAQRSNAPLNGNRRKVAGARPRGLNVAVTTAALPAVILSSVALAQPASAAPAPQTSSARHFAAAAVTLPSRAVVPAALVAGQVPARNIAISAQTVPSEYTIKPGDTIGAIAKRYGLSTDAVLKLNGMTTRTIIYPGRKIRLTGSAPAATPAPAPAAPSSGTTYVVKPGDTLGAIAARNGVSLQSVLTANNLSLTSTIYPGQKIRLSGASQAPAPVKPAPAPVKPAPAPAPAVSTYTVKAGDTLGAIAARNGVSLQSLLTANNLSLTSTIYPGQTLKLTAVTTQPTPPKATQPAPAPAPASYTVKAGDTLGAIASRNGVSLSALLAANRMTTATVIYPGQKLILPGKDTTAAPAPAPSDLVPSTFLGYTYPDRVVADANANKALLNSLPAPSPAEMKQIVADTARSMGVDPSLALAFAHQESGFNQRAVSPANAIGTMQVIPSSGEWASDLVGRKLNLLDPYDNATAGIAIIRSLVRTSPSLDIAIASYYQGQYSVQTRGMFEDTKQYVASIKAHQKNFR